MKQELEEIKVLAISANAEKNLTSKKALNDVILELFEHAVNNRAEKLYISKNLQRKKAERKRYIEQPHFIPDSVLELIKNK